MMIDEFLFKNILKTFFKLEQNITRLWWLPPTHYYDSICCNFDFELGSNTKKKEEKRRNKKKEDKNTLGATGRRSEMTMLLHKSDIVIASYDLICILTSRLEIYLSLSIIIIIIIIIIGRQRNPSALRHPSYSSPKSSFGSGTRQMFS